MANAINFSGYGGLPIPKGGYTFKVFANDILNYADVNKINKLNLFGYSMGGYAAFYFAKQHPDRVAKIATLNVKFNWDIATTQKEMAMLNANKILEKIPAFATKLITQHGADLWKDVLTATADMMGNLSKDIVLTEEDFKQIGHEVLLCVGDKDTTTTIEETLAIHRQLPKSQLCIFPKTPHPFDKINMEMLVFQLKRFFEDK